MDMQCTCCQEIDDSILVLLQLDRVMKHLLLRLFDPIRTRILASVSVSSQRKELVILESSQRRIVTARRSSRKSVEPIINRVSGCDYSLPVSRY